MTFPITDHDRRSAWRAMRRRAEVDAPSWRSTVVDDAIEARATDPAFDALLAEDAAGRWNAVAAALRDAVIADLVAAMPDADDVATYVAVQLYDWLMLPSPAGMAAFVATSVDVAERWGLRRDLIHVEYGFQTFHPDRRGVPRVVLRDVTGGMMVDLVDSWPHLGGFMAVTAVADTAGHLFVLDVHAREHSLVPARLLRDLEELCRGWRTLLAEYRSACYQAERNIDYHGIAPLPEPR